MNKTFRNTLLLAIIVGAVFTYISTFRTYASFDQAPSGEFVLLEQRGFPFVYETKQLATNQAEFKSSVLMADFVLHAVFAGSLVTSIASWRRLNP